MQRAPRYQLTVPVILTAQEKTGVMRRIHGKALDVSAEGMRVEIRDRIESGTAVVVQSNEYGRLGQATVRYYRRDGMRCVVGLRFAEATGLSDVGRRKILNLIPSNK